MAESERLSDVDLKRYRDLVSLHEQVGAGSALLLEQERLLLGEIDRLKDLAVEWALEHDRHVARMARRSAKYNGELAQALAAIRKERNELAARVEAGRAVHAPFDYEGEQFCQECSDGGGDGSRGFIRWPCATETALNPIDE